MTVKSPKKKPKKRKPARMATKSRVELISNHQKIHVRGNQAASVRSKISLKNASPKEMISLHNTLSSGADYSEDDLIKRQMDASQALLKAAGITINPIRPPDYWFVMGKDNEIRVKKMSPKSLSATSKASTKLSTLLAKKFDLSPLDDVILASEIIEYGAELLKPELPRELILRYAFRFQERTTLLQQFKIDSRGARERGGADKSQKWLIALVKKLRAMDPNAGPQYLWTLIDEEFQDHRIGEVECEGVTYAFHRSGTSSNRTLTLLSAAPNEGVKMPLISTPQTFIYGRFQHYLSKYAPRNSHFPQ